MLLLHMDNVMGAGVELIDAELFRNEDICYSLTWTVEPGACPQAKALAHCGYNSRYFGSHDAFVFSIKKERHVNDFAVLNFNGDSDGQENVLIWFFRNVLHYRVLNPCKVIHIYHQHCSKIHTRSGGRVNKGPLAKNGISPFTEKLF